MSADAKVILRTLIPRGVEVIGASAFSLDLADAEVTEVAFEEGSRLREIAPSAFCGVGLESFTVPASVRTIGESCFERCCSLREISFARPSTLRTVARRAFAGCKLSSIRIPASTQEIDGSAFAGCPLLVVRIAPASRNFRVERNLLLTWDARVIVRAFGVEHEIVVPGNAEMLGNACLQGRRHLARIVFTRRSRLRRIGQDAFSDCRSLASILIPLSVEGIEEFAFEKCFGLESFLVWKNSSLALIENSAFRECDSLRAFATISVNSGLGHQSR
jgi:hypothetical protein